jgi:hypothetical protein
MKRNQLQFFPLFLLMLLCIGCSPDERNLKVHVVLHNNQAEKLKEDWKELLLPEKDSGTLIIKTGDLIVSDSFVPYNRPLDWFDELRAKITKIKQIDQIKPAEKSYLDGLSLPLVGTLKDTTFAAIQERVLTKTTDNLVYLALAQSKFDTMYEGFHLRGFSTIDEIKTYLNYQASPDSNYIVISGFDFLRNVGGEKNGGEKKGDEKKGDEKKGDEKGGDEKGDVKEEVKEEKEMDSIKIKPPPPPPESKCPKKKPQIVWLSLDKKSICIKDELAHKNAFYAVMIFDDDGKKVIDAKQYQPGESIIMPQSTNSYQIQIKVYDGTTMCPKSYSYSFAVFPNSVISGSDCTGFY